MMSPELLDHELIYSAIYRANRARKGWALALTEDDVQDLACRILRMFSRNYDPSRSKPSTFIYKSAKLALMGLASNYKKKSGRTQIQAVLFDLDKPAPEPEQDQLDNLDKSAVFFQLSEAVQCLEPRTKAILDMFYVQDRTNIQIAAHLGISEARVGVLKRRGLESLRFFLSGVTLDALQES